MANFKQAITHDHDLQSIVAEDRSKILAMLYILTGCDFTSFFGGLEKSSFLKVFFHFSEFITGDTRIAPGTLANGNPEGNGILAFIRLVESAYIIKNQTAFGDMLPPALFITFQSSSTDVHEIHCNFYNHVRNKVWERITFEDQLPPSIDVLKNHWLRGIWVYDYWGQSCCENIIPLPLELLGWKVEDKCISVECDSPENMMAVMKNLKWRF